MVRLIYARLKHTSCGEMPVGVQQELLRSDQKETQSVKRIENKLRKVKKK